MQTSTTSIPRARRTNTRNKILASLPLRDRPGLAVDTSFSRHKAGAPTQLFPSQNQELSFVSLGDIKTVKRAEQSRKEDAQRLDNKTYQKAIKVNHAGLGLRVGDNKRGAPAASASRPNATSGKRNEKRHGQSVPVRKRVQGLWPSPLTLSEEISPSERAITIGIAVDPDMFAGHITTPETAIAGAYLQKSAPYRRPSRKQSEPELSTPTIVITPAREDFGPSGPIASPDDANINANKRRPSSSVYSRVTDFKHCNKSTSPAPPLPQLPLLANSKTRECFRDSTQTIFEEEAQSVQVPKHEDRISVCTVFDEDQPSAQDSSYSALLPTPRRSKGWWSVITSPFSASSKSPGLWFRSPPFSGDNTGERTPMLDDVSDMAESNPHGGLVFTNRMQGDFSLRSAPPADSRCDTLSKDLRPRKRSDTAPGALDPSGKQPFNIYRIPSTGDAAAYYNPHKHFPSLIALNEDGDGCDRELDGWSPSQSVYRSPRAGRKGLPTGDGAEADASDSDTAFEDDPDEDNLKDLKGPFDDFSGIQPAANAQRELFASPLPEELRGATPPPRPEPARADTQATATSYFSPLSPTPVVEDAKLGTFVGPTSAREVELPAARSASPQWYSRGLEQGTMASRSPPQEQARARENGLGIDADSASEKTLYPPPPPLIEQPRLGTDRFGQLCLTTKAPRDLNRPQWYRRFMWPIIALVAALLLLLIVLLAVFVPQEHADMPVQAAWVNLTGFPPLPTGVVTISQPQLVQNAGACVQPPGLWSCRVPDAASDAPTPDFRLQIRFRNATSTGVNATSLAPALRKQTSVTAQAGQNVRRSLNAWRDGLFAASPAPPSRKDRLFLGRATDNVSAPYDGEATPFSLTLLDALALVTSDVQKRQAGAGPTPTSAPAPTTSTTSSGNAYPVPSPRLLPNGFPAPDTLYPLVRAQPLRLYNRAQPSEHYAFFAYFDRQLPATTAPNTTTTQPDSLCVFADTRLHLQIWTRRGTAGAPALAPLTPPPPAINSTANALGGRGGSLPYAATVTLDRHGGREGRKGVFCHGLDATGRVVDGSGTWVAEEGSGGGVGGDGNGGEGMDGGSGGCGCAWE